MSTYYVAGNGIGSLAGAAYLIRDQNVAGDSIFISENAHDFGGALDAHSDWARGYSMSDSRMFTKKSSCTFDLISAIASTRDPHSSVTHETNQAQVQTPRHDTARPIDRDHRVTNCHTLGYNERDRIDVFALTAKKRRSPPRRSFHG